jgi:hypothetical protein
MAIFAIHGVMISYSLLDTRMGGSASLGSYTGSRIIAYGWWAVFACGKRRFRNRSGVTYTILIREEIALQ